MHTSPRHWTSSATGAPTTERQRLAAARDALWRADAPEEERAGTVVQPVAAAHLAADAACAVIGLVFLVAAVNDFVFFLVGFAPVRVDGHEVRVLAPRSTRRDETGR